MTFYMFFLFTVVPKISGTQETVDVYLLNE